MKLTMMKYFPHHMQDNNINLVLYLFIFIYNIVNVDIKSWSNRNTQSNALHIPTKQPN